MAAIIVQPSLTEGPRPNRLVQEVIRIVIKRMPVDAFAKIMLIVG